MSHHIRWQATLAFLGLILIFALLSYAAYSYTSELVPARGGVFVEGVAGNPQYINPVLCQYNDVDRDLCALIYSGLLRFDESGSLQPDLAESWQASPASDVFTFTLRSDARWHDGLRVTADDVLFTVELMQDPDLPVLPDLQHLWRTVIAKKVDDRTLVFQLQEPYAPFPDYTTIRWFGVLPKHYWERYRGRELTRSQLNTQPIGSGPFRLTEIDAEHVRLEPNPRAFERPPFLDALEFRFYPDYASVLAAAETGEVQGVSRVPPELTEQAEAASNLQLFTSPQPGYTLILFNFDNPNALFLTDLRVRQALAYALDRKRIVEEIAYGVGVLANGPILPESWAYNPDTPTYAYDPQKAQSLLSEAGWLDSDGDGVRDKDGAALEMILIADDAPATQQIAQAVAADWARVGVHAEFQPVSLTGLVTDFLQPRNFAAAILNWELIGDPDPYPLWHSSQISPAGQNYGGWNSRNADIVMEQARRTSDLDMRRQLYQDFQNIFAEEIPAILLYYPLYTYGVIESVQNVEVGLLNEPSDRFRTFDQWYVLTRKETLANRRSLQLDNSGE